MNDTLKQSDWPIKLTECHFCGNINTRTSGICISCAQNLGKEEFKKDNNENRD